MTPEVVFIPYSDLTLEIAKQLVYLAFLSWPSNKNDVELDQAAEELIKRHRPAHIEKPAGFAMVTDNGIAVARAEFFPRVVKFGNRKITLMALGGVCSHPEKRGFGYGKMVVEYIFGFVDKELYPATLFQTTEEVHPFYEKLGAKRISNPIINSTAKEPAKCPFWDDAIMMYSPHFEWPEGTIDLLGPGY